MTKYSALASEAQYHFTETRFGLQWAYFFVNYEKYCVVENDKFPRLHRALAAFSPRIARIYQRETAKEERDYEIFFVVFSHVLTRFPGLASIFAA
jgi:hypothetical protein